MIKYKIQFSNRINEDYYVFLDKKSYTGDITSITGTAEVVSIRSLNNDDDRFSPIISKECNISMWIPAGQSVSITDFLANEDDEWRVTIKRELELPPIFDGYLVIEDSSEPLYDRPFKLAIRASDGLPLLKSVPLKRADGTLFRNLNSITDYIGHILYTLNPHIPFRVYSDVYHKSMDVTICSLEQTQVQAKTFKKDGSSFMDCYSVLESIMNDLGLRLFYENGYWHIVSISEYQNTGFSWHEYKVINGEVVHQDSISNEPLIAKIGKTEVIQAINKDAQIYYKVANKSVKKTYNYEIPKELICNQELMEGTKLPLLSTPASGVPNSVSYVPARDYYTADCYLSSRSVFAVLATTKDFYIRTEYDSFGYEIDRYLLIPREPQATYIQTSSIPVHENDEFSFSVDVKIKEGDDFGRRQSEPPVMYVILMGDDGTVWNLTNQFDTNKTSWAKTLINNPHGIWSPTAISGEWVTVTASANTPNVDSGKMNVPVTGDVYIVLAQLDSFTTFFPQNETYYKNLQATYAPYIKNSYHEALGDFNIYDQDLKINRTIDEPVKISDSPKKIIKGALFVNDALATPEWFRIGRTESLRFMQLQTLIKYNFHFRQFQKVEGTLKGLSLFNASDVNIPFGFLPQYSLSDIPNSPKYILTSITDCNYLEGQWRGVIVEIPAEEPQFDNYDFQYLFK